MTPLQEPNLSVKRNLKIGFFHLGSGMADVVATGIWNRIMISDLGYAATPVGLLVSLRYFLAPLSVWAGRMSDQRVIFGYRRLFWIWLGRLMMAASVCILGVSTAALTAGGGAAGMTGQDAGLWAVIVLSMLLFSVGNAFSGGTFLALIYDRSSATQRGRAVGIVWTFLLIGFAVGGVVFGLMLPAQKEGQTGLTFTPERLQNVFVLGGLILGALWFLSLLGEEKRARSAATVPSQSEYSTSIRADLKLAMSQRPMRFFFWYLALSMFFAFSQDLILEPFGGQVFGMDARITTRFTSYWASMAILGTVVFLFVARRYKWWTNTRMSVVGVALLLVTFAVFAVAAFAQIRPLVTPGLILLGLGLGIWNVGTLGLMMEMSPFGRAGTFLGFWTLVVTLARGLGVTGGGILRDLGLAASGNLPIAYGVVFALGAVGLGVSLWALRQVKVETINAEQPASSASVLAAAMD